MPQRSATETVITVIRAFNLRNTWRQDELARFVGTGVPAVRRCILELIDVGKCAIEKQEEHPFVYWSVQKGWMNLW